MTHGLRRSARAFGLVCSAAAVVYLLVAALAAMEDVPIADRFYQLVALWYLVPGAVVVLRRDGHMVGWLLVANGLLWAIQLSSEVAGGGLGWLPAPWLAWVSFWIGNAEWACAVALFVLFPDGLAHRTPRQRRAGQAMIGTAVAATVAAMFAAEVGRDSLHGAHPNPIGVGPVPVAIADYLIVPVGLVAVASVVRLWHRSRRVSGVQRQQYRWVLFSFAVVIAGLAIGLVFSGIFGADAAWIPIVVGWFLIPTAFSVAILRYRLYDIDKIVSRTVAYVLITAIVSAIYAMPVVGLPELFDLRGPLPVAAATLAAAAAFSPVRRAVQSRVDRRFNRAQFDRRRELDAFSMRLRSQVDLDGLVEDINALVARNLQPAVAITWIRPRDGRVRQRPMIP